MINFTRIGSGEETIIVLSGWIGDYTIFNPMLENINKDLFSYYFIDYRGYGKSKGIQGNYSINEIATDTIEFLVNLNIEKVSLIGHSMGGLAVQQIAILRPDIVKKIIAIAPVPASGYPMDSDTKELFFGSVDDSDKRKAILDFTTGNKQTDKWLEMMTQVSLATTEKNAYKGYLESWTETDIQQGIKGSSIPILVCYGENDPAISKQMMNETFMKWFTNPKLVELKDAGHYPMQETPFRLANIIENFLIK